MRLNGAVVRKEFGYEHIHRRHAARFDTYCREYLNQIGRASCRERVLVQV